MNSNKQNLINQIKYRSYYRGTKEMDIFVSSFVESIINELNYKDLVHLNNLINLNDEQIVDISKGLLKIEINEKIINLLVNFKKK
ncbi:MAG: succinate dehydrogenase assembly factor 2 [Candidatus Pelagibacter sp.]|tara:strand:- start:33 stop:287 length:255 start_codon:yes stop_codon:yes gene_type:complete